MTTRICISPAVVLGSLLVVAPLAKADSGIKRHFPYPGGDLETVGEYRMRWSGPVTFRVGEATATPNSYPDVVLDVFKSPSGPLLSEARWTGSNAQVDVSTDQGWMFVIVRMKVGSSPSSQTMVPLSWSSDSGTTWRLMGRSDLSEGTRIVTSGLRTRTVVQTVQEPAGYLSGSTGGASDTILMVLQDDKPIAFDDDNGIERMSWLKLDTACVTDSSTGKECTIVPMRRSNLLQDRYGCTKFPDAGPGSTTVVWDEDVAGAWGDLDGDGLGNSLEVSPSFKAAFGNNTSNVKPDSDDDGVPDGAEVLGIFDFNDQNPKQMCQRNLRKFPYYGGDPTKMDLFVEVDWLPMCRANPTTCKEGHPAPIPGVTDKDGWQWSSSEAKKYVARFLPDLYVHVDIGPWAGMQDDYDRGDWGGAARVGDEVYVRLEDLDKDLPDKTSAAYLAAKAVWDKYDGHGFNACQGFGKPINMVPGTDLWMFSGPRFGMFHPGLSHWLGQCFNTGLGTAFCPDGNQSIHETGHFFGIGHWGINTSEKPVGESACKANYFSVVSYCVGPNTVIGNPGTTYPGYSHGMFTSGGKYGEVVLNPAHMDEGKGLGTKDLDVLNYVKTTMGRKVGDDPSKPDYGGVDWDDDGEIEVGKTVRAFLNHGGPQSSGEKAWQGDGDRPPTATGAQEFKTYDDAHNFIGHDSMAIFPDASNEFGFGLRFAHWVNGKTMLAHLIPSRKVFCLGDNFCEKFDADIWTLSITSHRISSMVEDQSMMVFQSNDGNLHCAGLFGDPPTRAEQTIAASGHMGPPAMVPWLGDFLIYSGDATPPSSGPAVSANLHGWELNPTNGNLHVGGQQYWADAGSTAVTIVPDSSIGATWGWVRVTDPATNIETNKQKVLAAIPSADPTSGADKMELATFVRDIERDPTTNLLHTVDRWQRESDLGRPDPLDMIQASRRRPSAGRVSLAYVPDDPANPADAGRYYMTWQWKNGSNEVPLVAVSRGNRLPVDPACTTPHGLCFPSFGRFNSGGTNWPAGISLLYAGGHLRGLLASGPREGGNRYFPHADGIVDMNQRDFNDWQHIKDKLPCALVHCSTLTK
jgi:hypothetical protein